MARNQLPKNCCTFAGCFNPVKAKGLCATHYMRARRTGDAAKVRAGGRTTDLHRRATRALFADWSERTFSRYWNAYRVLCELGGDIEARLKNILDRISRPNGSFSVSEFQREVTRELFQFVKSELAK